MQENMYNYDNLKKKMRKRIFDLSCNNADKICIFGAGKRGIKLCKELYSRFIEVDFFSDNSQEKIGMEIEGIKIISFEELKKQKNNVIVIISAADYSDIEKQLINSKFPYVFTMNNFQKLYSDIIPVRWLEEFDRKIDYTEEKTKGLINLFKKTILDICYYYENIE